MTTKARLLTMGASLAFLPMSWSQTNHAAIVAPAVTLSPTEQVIHDIKQPVSWFSWGADLRFRNEYFYDILTLNPNNPLHEQDYLRFRGRLWTSITPVDGLSLNVRLVSEPREWLKPAGYTPMKGRSGLDMTEGVFDSLNVQWKNMLDLPANLTVGRQDIFLGDGWLVGDGTPYDGSWTYFLDSARFNYEFKEQHTTVEAIGILQDRYDDGWMPVINSGQHRFLTEQNEKGAILSIANSTIREANVTGYFIYKEDDGAAGGPRGMDNANIYTFGGRLTGLAYDHWKYSAEGAYQFGRKQDLTVQFPSKSTEFRAMNTFGFNSKLSYLVKDKLNNQFSLSLEILSGDNPNTGSDEMFDVLWGRWPRWSEIALYSYAAETRIGQQANLNRFGPTWSFYPVKNLEFSSSYYALFALESIPTREASPTLFSNDGYFRGHFVQTFLKYKLSQHLSASLWGEILCPGDFYAYKNMMTFLRAEVMFTF